MLRDCHCHMEFNNYTLEESKAHFEKYMEKYGTEIITFLTIPSSPETQDDPLAILKALWMKKALAPHAYVYMGMQHYFDARDTAENYLAQLERAMDMGCDGIKIIDGKPDFRKRLGKRMDDPVFDLFYAKAEREQIPIILHACDPQENWDKSKIGDIAIKMGWCYDDPSFRTCEEIYSEVFGLLEKFPNLNLTLAHFFFMSAQLERLDNLLEKYPNLKLDICPGSEMFFNFSNNIEQTKQFFEKHYLRIQFGTDLDNEPGADDWYDMVYPVVKEFIVGNKEFTWLDKKVIPLNLDNEKAEAILYYNNIRINGKWPHMLNYTAIQNEIARIKNEETLTEQYKKDLAQIETYLK